MAAERLPMRKLREIIRLKLQAGQSGRAIARSCALSPRTVAEYLGRIALAGLAWPLPPETRRRRGAREAAVPGRAPARVEPARARLDLHSPRVAAAARDQATAVAGVQGGHAERAPVLPVLRSVPALGAGRCQRRCGR